MIERKRKPVQQPDLCDENGQTMVETALVLPIVCMLIFGIYAFAIVLFGWCNITYAARNASRYASVHSNASLGPATTAKITALVSPYLYAVPSGGSTTTIAYGTTNTIGGTVSVTVQAKYNVYMPWTTYKAFTVASTAQRTITR